MSLDERRTRSLLELSEALRGLSRDDLARVISASGWTVTEPGRPFWHLLSGGNPGLERIVAWRSTHQADADPGVSRCFDCGSWLHATGACRETGWPS